VQLRAEALEKRGQQSYNKLWDAIGALNRQFGLSDRGHLEQIISRSRPVLMQYQNRFELLPDQLGALFFIHDRLAGIEITPSPAYFQEVWMALVCFSYGVAALMEERKAPPGPPALPFPATNLPELREQLQAGRRAWQVEVGAWLARTPAEQFALHEEERMLDLRLHTVSGQNFAGQIVEDDQGLVYASVFARPTYLAAA
jgi:hypothetical protein